MRNSLVLLTLGFPYGLKEPFLETEIKYLSKCFDRIFILPSSTENNHRRATPQNVTILSEVALGQSDFNWLKVIPFSLELLVILFYTFIHSPRRVKYIRYLSSFIHYFYIDIQKIKAITGIIDKYSLQNALFYDYWMMNAGLSLSVLRRKGKIRAFICRAHGFDLYDNRNIEGTVPFREYKIEWAKVIYPISMHGNNYLLERIRKKYNSKVLMRYLGVDSAINLPQMNNENIIVSCSAITPLKQVHLIAKAIEMVNLPCRWVHFGNGPMMAQIKDIIDRFPSFILVTLKGEVPNNKVLEFYSNNYVSLFISLSSSEGLPVSMMEAQAYGIPIIAPDVNGISEIVTPDTGILLDEDYTQDQVVKAINKILTKKIKLKREKIINFFETNFLASTNYQHFAEEISQLN